MAFLVSFGDLKMFAVSNTFSSALGECARLELTSKKTEYVHIFAAFDLKRLRETAKPKDTDVFLY